LESLFLVSLESVLLGRFEFFSQLFAKGQPDEKTALPVYLTIFVLAQYAYSLLALYT
jgi:hypothetical protein